MDFTFSAQAEDLRTRLRSMIDERLPPGFLGAFTDDPADLAITIAFCHALADAGELVLAWPSAYGGADGSVWDQTVVREEMWAHHEPRGPQYMGLNWVGPAIMAFGTDAQKNEHLPKIAAGDVIWCQGFSEPDAGSDLASLKTRAEPVEGGFRITGQKIWTSYAEMAQWCVLAARVGSGAKKHEGITLFVLPVDREGITIRPIRSTMLGRHHLNEVFFDEVFVGDDEVLGPVGEGWAAIRHALAHERVGIARYARCERLLSLLRAHFGDRWSELPEAIRVWWARALVEVRAARLLSYRAIAAQAAGGAVDADASLARVVITQTDQLVAELLFRALGEDALRDGAHGGVLAGAVEDHWRYAQAATVASGTIEMQRTLVARSVLGGRR